MRLKLRIGDGKQISRSEIDIIIREIRLHQNKLDDTDTMIEVCFKEGPASGVIEMTREELHALNLRIKNAIDSQKHDYSDEENA